MIFSAWSSSMGELLGTAVALAAVGAVMGTWPISAEKERLTLDDVVAHDALAAAHQPRLLVLAQLGRGLVGVQHLDDPPPVLVRLLGDGARPRDGARVELALADDEGLPGGLSAGLRAETGGLGDGRSGDVGGLVAVVSVEGTGGDGGGYQRTRDGAELHRRGEDGGRRGCTRAPAVVEAAVC